jgi:hypothetical protein
MANVGWAVLLSQDLKVYSYSQYPQTMASAPQNGGAAGKYAWMALGDLWTDAHYDQAHAYVLPDGRTLTLQRALAHEIDHLMNRDHLNAGYPNEDLYFTTFTEYCGLEGG